MDVELKPGDENSLSVSSYEVRESLILDQETKRGVSKGGSPTLEGVLRELGPLPEQALFFGIAKDNLPILLNLWDPRPGPILIAGDSRTGKTDLLKVIASFVLSSYQACEIQYGVITTRPQEWYGYVDYPHCIGLFSMTGKSVVDLMRALTMWIEIDKVSRQAVLLLIDGLHDFQCRNMSLSRELQEILVYGPAKKIWPVVTLDLKRVREIDPWLNYFHTWVFGYTEHADLIGEIDPSVQLDCLSRGMEFSVQDRAKSEWIRFRIPRI